MSRPTGGYIGFNRVPAASAFSSAAIGVWTLREAEANLRAGTWPNTFVNPTSQTGLQLWLDASDSSTLFDATTGGSLVAADGAVARWEDKSGNARHATQSTNGPIYKTNQINGRSTLSFNGSNSTMSISGSATSLKFLHNANNTIFVVVRCGTTSSPEVIGAIFDSTGSATLASEVGVVLWYDDRVTAGVTNDDLVYGIGSGSGLNSVIRTANTLTANTYVVLTLAVKPGDGAAANRIKRRINGGAESGSNTFTGGTSSSNSTSVFTIGTQGNLGNPFGGNIAELIIYNSVLSDANRAAVESYLMTKWGIS